MRYLLYTTILNVLCKNLLLRRLTLELPIEFKNKYRQLLNEEFSAFIDTFEEPSTTGYRLNPLKKDEVIDRNYLANERVSYAQNGYFGNVNGKEIDHVSGYVYSQEPSAMYVGEVVDAQPGEYVLDLCAAPGGKSTHIAAQMAGQGVLVSNEIFKKRADILASNIERWGVKNSIITNESPEKLEKKWSATFDRILVDAPCSGEGMFRKDPESVKYWTPDYSSQCANRQRNILNSAVKMLKPGGTLIYSTCTFAPEEDEQIVKWLLDTHPNFELQPIKKYPGMDDGRPKWAKEDERVSQTVRMFPHHIKGEGHFIAKFKKSADADMTISKFRKHREKQQNNLSKEESKLLNEFIEQTHLKMDNSRLISNGDHLYMTTDIQEKVKLNGLKVITPGLLLGTFKKNRFEPSYTFALALNNHQIRSLAISLSQWRQYVHGETVMIDESLSNGWYLVTCNQHSVGFGKLVNHTVKNFFPKGLRF